jgi:hypothetical protein
MAAIGKCPNCGGDVLDGYCYACGVQVAEEKAPNSGAQTDYADPQNGYPNIKVADDEIIYDKPAEEDFYTKYNRMGFGDKLGKYWWFILLSLLFPFFWLVPAIWAASVALFDKTPGRGKFAFELAMLALVGVILLG